MEDLDLDLFDIFEDEFYFNPNDMPNANLTAPFDNIAFNDQDLASVCTFIPYFSSIFILLKYIVVNLY